MRKRDQEHYEIARKFGAGRPFTRSEFNRHYYEEYPNRVSGPIPSDYCINLSPKVAERCPKFLRWLGRGRYEFIAGLAEMDPYPTGETMGSSPLEEREQLLRDLERYRTLRGYTTDEQAIAAIEQLIREICDRLDRLEARDTMPR